MVKTRARDAWYDETRHLLDSSFQELDEVPPEARELAESHYFCLALLRAGVSPRALLLDALSNVVVRKIAPRDPRGRREDEAADELAFEAYFLAVAVGAALKSKAKAREDVYEIVVRALEKPVCHLHGAPISFAARLGEQGTLEELKAAVEWALDNRRRHADPLEAVRRVYAIPPAATLRSLREAGLRAAKRRAERADAVRDEVHRLLLGVTGKSGPNSRHSATSSPEKILSHESKRSADHVRSRADAGGTASDRPHLETHREGAGLHPTRDGEVRASGLRPRRDRPVALREDLHVDQSRDPGTGRQKRGLKEKSCRREKPP